MTTKTKTDDSTETMATDFYFWLGQDADAISCTETEFNERIEQEKERQRKFREVTPD